MSAQDDTSAKLAGFKPRALEKAAKRCGVEADQLDVEDDQLDEDGDIPTAVLVGLTRWQSSRKALRRT